MRGTIQFINLRRGRIAVLVADSDWCAFELLEVSADLAVGDTLTGDLEAGGGEPLLNERTGQRISVFIEITHGTRATALAWALTP